MIPTRVHAAVFLVAALCLGGAPAVVAAQSNVTLTVTVVDQDGDAVSGVDISATWDDGGPVDETTRSNGQALVDVPEGANVTLSVDDEDYVRNAPLEIQDAEGRRRRGPGGRGRLGDRRRRRRPGLGREREGPTYQGGDRIADARTRSDGSFTTRDIEQGDYEVRVWKEGYLRNSTDLTVDGDVTHEVRVSQDSRLLQVTVSDDHFSPPQAVANASVRVRGCGHGVDALQRRGDRPGTGERPVRRHRHQRRLRDQRDVGPGA